METERITALVQHRVAGLYGASTSQQGGSPCCGRNHRVRIDHRLGPAFRGPTYVVDQANRVAGFDRFLWSGE
jgi:hypothetical protein